MSPLPSTVRYAIDPTKSRFTVRAYATGILSGLGHSPTFAIRNYTGLITMLPGSHSDATLEFRVQADSLAVIDDVSDKDRKEIERVMRDEVLEVARYPEITFLSRQISESELGGSMFAVKLVGDMSIHGVMQSRTMTAQMTQSNESMRAYGEFILRQTDFGIKPISIMGGTLKIKDEIKLSFDIVARVQA